MSRIKAKLFLAGYCLIAMAANAQDRLAAKDLSFFEYLGSMVEEDGGWVDPLDMENADLARLEDDETEEEPAAGKVPSAETHKVEQ